MPHSERQMQTGTSTMRAMTQEMNAGLMMSVERSQRKHKGRDKWGVLYRGGLVWRPWAFATQRLHALAIDPNCGQRMLVWMLPELGLAP